MLWSPTFSVDSDESDRGRIAELGRDVVEPLYMLAVYALALAGAFVVPRRFLALSLLLLGYSTLAAMAFAGTVRYRAPFDFLLALLAAAALVRGLERLHARRGARGAAA
jgi:asparagine N-glycosylation enzyme membrane subunit Stt3